MKPTIMFDNALKRAFSPTSYEYKLCDELLLDLYSTPSDITIEANLPAPESVDALGITMHNLSHLTLEYFDGSYFIPIYDGTPSQVDFVRFTSCYSSRFRITLSTLGDDLYVGNLFLGESMTLGYGFSGFTPAHMMYNDKIFTAQNSQNIGISNVKQKQARSIHISQEYIKKSYFDEKYSQFLASVGTNHFYLDYFDKGYCLLANDSKISTSIKNSLTSFKFDATILTKEDFI